jgi:hypothetical protein
LRIALQERPFVAQGRFYNGQSSLNAAHENHLIHRLFHFPFP